MIWWLLKKLNIELPYDPAIPLLIICPKELKWELEQIFEQGLGEAENKC